jgi:membrane-associated phospholipid phosphatase
VRRDAALAAGFAAGFAALTAALAAGGALLELDLSVQAWVAAHRPPAAEAVARVLNRLGQGGALLGICVALAGWLALVRWRRAAGWWETLRPPLYVLAAAVLVVPTVLGIKHLTERGAPSSPLPAEQTVRLTGPLPPGEYAEGYPGGHAVNTVVWYGVLLALVVGLSRAYRWAEPPRPVRIAVRVVPPVVVLLTTTYLSFHWLTDSLAGLALGIAIDRVLALLRGAP